MEVKSVNSFINATPIKNKVNNKAMGKQNFTSAQITELPNINSQNYALNINVPQKYAHIGSFEIPQVGMAHFYKLESGQKVVIIPKDGETVIKTHVNVGSMNEKDNIRGISHYIEHNLFNGTDELGAGEFFKQTSQMGARTNASTSFAKTDYFIATHLLDDSDFEKSIKLHADMLENPTFKQDQLEKERGPVISEIAMVLDDDTNLAINKAIKNLFQIKSNSTDLIAGEVKNIQNVTRDDVVKYYNNWYTPDNMVTVITGEVDPDETIKLISQNFKKSKVQNKKENYFEQLTPIEKTVREDFVSKKSPSSKIVIAAKGPQNNNLEDNIKTEALIMFLMGYKSSPLNKKLLKNGTSINAAIEKISNNPINPSAILFEAETTSENTEKTLKTIYNEIENVSNFPPNIDDVETIKNHLLKNYSTMADDNSELNNFAAHALLNGNPQALVETVEIIKKLTPQDIQETAQKYLDLHKLSIAVSHANGITSEQMTDNYINTNKVVSFGKKDSAKKEVINPQQIKKFVLQNNSVLLTNPSKNDLSVARIFLNTEIPTNINPAAGYILSEIFNEGYQGIDKNKFQSDLDYKAISMDFDATNEGISILFSANEKDLDFAIGSSINTLKSPKIDQATFENALNKVKNKYKSTSDDAATYAMKEILGNDYPQFGTSKDTLKQLEKVSIQDVYALYNYIMQNSSMSTAITTKNADKVSQNPYITAQLNSAGIMFKPFNKGLLKTYKSIQNDKFLTNKKEQKQAEICQVYTFEGNMNTKDDVTIELMNTILGGNPSSRLFNDLREKQKLAYRVNSNIEKFGNTSIARLNILTTTEDKENGVEAFENVQKSLDGFKKHIEKLKTEYVSKEELNSAKRFLKSRLLSMKDFSTDKNDAIISTLNRNEGLEYYNECMKLIDEITPQDILNAANYVFKGKSVTSIVASENTINAIK